MTSPPAANGRTLGLGGLVIELLLPGALSAALLLVLASYTAYWDLHTRIGLGVFGFLLATLSLLLSIQVDRLTLARRRERGRKQLLNRASSRARLVKFILGGVVIPIGALAAANLLELPNHQTPMALALQLRLSRPSAARAERLGNAVLRAQTADAREQGILALQTMGSGEALDQLLRILSEDPAALSAGGEYQALGRALASYGAQAKGRLRQRFDQVSPGARRGAAAPPGDLFERYFSAGFEGLRKEMDGRSPDPRGQTRARERLQALQAELREALSEVETDAPPAEGNRLPVFIMQTFLQMGLQEDADLLRFARQTAADADWSDAVRGQALLLIAKLGGKDDLDELYTYLESPSRRLQARAMQAIAALQSKLAAAGPLR